MSRAFSVLHVVESFGGGVATALQQYALATPKIKHYLLRTERPGDYIDSGETEAFAKVFSLPSEPLAAIRTIKKLAKELQPNVVHAHSSFAGVYVRIGIKATRRRSIVYTPHGYASERADISPRTSLAFRMVEAVLSCNTSRYAACSPREAALSKFWTRGKNVLYVPNVAEPQSINTERESEVFTEIVVVGRLTPARDPDFFAEVVQIVKRNKPQIKFTWVGGGEEGYVSRLTSLGVEVTGWLPRHLALQKLSGASLHLHPAAWDGFPMVLLEANAMRIPSLIRDIPAFSDVPGALKISTPETCASRILDIEQSREMRLDLLHMWDMVLRENVSQVQEERLLQAYGLMATAAAA